MTTLMVLLFLNKKWIKVDNLELYNFTVWIAQSPSKLMNEVVKAIEKFIKTYLIKIDVMIDEVKDDEEMEGIPLEKLRGKGARKR